MDVKPLEKVMKKLREPGGCPWDRAQNHKTLRKDFLEEVYEFLETVDNDDVAGMREELGDVLLQVIFHARLEEEDLSSMASYDAIESKRIDLALIVDTRYSIKSLCKPLFSEKMNFVCNNNNHFSKNISK